MVPYDAARPNRTCNIVLGQGNGHIEIQQHPYSIEGMSRDVSHHAPLAGLARRATSRYHETIPREGCPKKSISYP